MRYKTFNDWQKSLKPLKKPVRGSYKAFILPNKKLLVRFINRNGYEIISDKQN